MLRFNVDWTVSGSPIVRVSEEELAEIGIDPNGIRNCSWLLTRLTSMACRTMFVADYDERQRLEITSVHLEEEEF